LGSTACYTSTRISLALTAGTKIQFGRGPRVSLTKSFPSGGAQAADRHPRPGLEDRGRAHAPPAPPASTSRLSSKRRQGRAHGQGWADRRNRKPEPIYLVIRCGASCAQAIPACKLAV